MNRDSRRLFVADPNGALIGGSNMEFLAMPLQKLSHRSTIKVSAYDRSEMKRLSQTVFIAKPNGEIVPSPPPPLDNESTSLTHSGTPMDVVANGDHKPAPSNEQEEAARVEMDRIILPVYTQTIEPRQLRQRAPIDYGHLHIERSAKRREIQRRDRHVKKRARSVTDEVSSER